MVTPKRLPTHENQKTKPFEEAAKIASMISSYADAKQFFEGETGRDIDHAITSLVQQKKRLLRKGLTLEAAQNTVRDGCANALWQAVSKHKQSDLEEELLKRRPTIPYTRREFEADMRALGEDPALLDFDSILQRRQSTGRGNGKEVETDDLEPPTIAAQLTDLAKRARRARGEVTGIVAELHYISQVNLLKAPVARNSRKPTHEDILKSEIHNTITRCRNVLATLDELAILTDRLSQNPVVGRQSDLFRATFVTAMITVWEQLTGFRPGRENKWLIGLISTAYACFTRDDFHGWDSVLRTELGKLPTRPAKRRPKAKKG